MKRAIVIGAVMMGLVTGSAFAADIKIGTVNLQKCFDEYYKTKQAEATLKEAADAYNKERVQLIQEFQKMQEERGKLEEEIAKPELSATAKADKKKESDAKLEDLKKQKNSIDEFDKVRRQQLLDQQNRMKSNIIKEITDKVSQISKAGNLTLVVDISGPSMNGTTIIVYAEDRLDISLDVVRELNKNAPAMGAPKPASTNAPAMEAPKPASTNAPAKPATK